MYIFNFLQKTHFANISFCRPGCIAIHSKIEKVNKIFLFTCILTSINSSLRQEPHVYPAVQCAVAGSALYDG